jgi:mono/diheme cytochrome c family protein
MVMALGAWTATPAWGQTGSGSAPTFNKDIAPIFYANCTSCHRAGEIGPMSLVTYKDVRPWVRSIGTKVADGSMPPWHADPAHGSFVNERRLTEAQKATIASWVRAGAPEGNPADLPPPPTFSEGWNIGQPDVILSMQEDYPIPAAGTVAYQYLEVPANFSEDRWITSWEMRPGNRAAVHHVIVYTKPPQPAAPPPPPAAGAAPAPPAQRPTPIFSLADGMEIPDGQTGGRPLPPEQRAPASAADRPRPRQLGPSIGGYVPGNSIRRYPEGTAMLLPAGFSLVFQMHYTPTGTATTDRTRIGLKFASSRPTVQLRSSSLVNGALRIPAGAGDHRVDAEMTVNGEVLLYSLLPHTHVRGKAWKFDVVYPDGRREVVLSVPKYDFDWQHEYVFREPLRLTPGTKILASAWYDNSRANKSNPDPTKEVTWGDQTWEEMMFTQLTFSVVTAPAPTAGR